MATMAVPGSGSRIIEWIQWGEEMLDCLPEGAGRESRRLLAEILEDPLAPWTRDREILPDSVSHRYRSWIERRRQREPFHLITGTVPFMGDRYEVVPGVLIPRPETESLVEKVEEVFASRRPVWILDLGCGTGVLGISLLKRFPTAHCLSIDRMKVPLQVSARNADVLGVRSRIRFVQGDWTEMIGSPGRFDLVVSNPPYIPSGDLSALEPEISLHEPGEALDGGPDGLMFYRRLMIALPWLLSDGGRAVAEIGADQGDFFRSKEGFVPGCGAPSVFPDVFGRDRIVLWTKG